MTTRSVTQFNTLWNAGRADGSAQSSLVSYGELNKALAAIKADGKVTRAEAKAVADVMANDPFMTRPAVQAAKEFLATVGKDHALDSTTVSAIKAEFALVAAKPFKHLELPGRKVKSTHELPDSVQQAAKDIGADFGDGETEIRSATIAGQKVYVVDFNSFDDDIEHVQLFSASGKQIATGGIDDAMAGFAWN